MHRASQGPVDLLGASTGLQVCGQGAWQSQKHGEKQRKCWKKLPIGVEDQGQIIAATITDRHAPDLSQVPTLLGQVERKIERFIGAGIDDQQPVYAAVEAHSPGASVIIPPRKDAVLRPTAGASPTPRDRHLLASESAGRFHWKRTSGYYDQGEAENALSR